MEIGKWDRGTGRAAREARPWIERLARAGYASRGVLYLTIGLLALLAAFGNSGGETTTSKGALREIQQQPFGQILLLLMIVGLAGYALWRFVQSILDPEHEGTDPKAIAKRVAWFVIGVLHVGLVVYAVGLLTGAALGGGGGTQSWTAKLMAWDPGGRLLVGIVGALVTAFALYQIVKAWKAKLDERLSLGQLEATTRRWVVGISRFGMAARGVVFAILGAFLVVAALRTDPSRARGLGQALGTLQAQSYGSILLGAAALGLVAYGIYEFVEARYRRIQAT